MEQVKVMFWSSINTLTTEVHTANNRLNALSVYLKIQNFIGAFIREGRLIKIGIYFKMHKFIKQK